MKKTISRVAIGILVLLAAFFAFRIWTKSHSPQTITTYKTNILEVQVIYSQPVKKGRTIFGGLVPYEKVWRTGANEATLIEFKQEVSFANQLVPAGIYTLWTIPGKSQWTIILNKETGQWGTSYDEKQDQLRVKVDANNHHSIVEKFNITLTPQDNGTDMHLQWDQTDVEVPIRLP